MRSGSFWGESGCAGRGPTRWSSTTVVAYLLGLALCGGLALPWPGAGRDPAAEARLRAWLSDRRAGLLVGLGAGGRRVVECRMPRAGVLAARSDGGVWCSAGVVPSLRWVDRNGEPVAQWAIPDAPMELVCLPDDSVIGLARDGELWRASSRQGPRPFSRAPGASWIRVDGWRLLVGGEECALGSWDLRGRATRLGVGPAGIRDAAPGPRTVRGERGWWTVEEAGRLLVLRDADLGERGALAVTGGTLERIAPGRGGVWGLGSPRARLWWVPWSTQGKARETGGDSVELARTPQARALASDGGGDVWVALCGAVVGGGGLSSLWSQGGFDEIVDLDVRPSGP